MDRIQNEFQIFNSNFVGYKDKQVENVAKLQQDLANQLDALRTKITELQVDQSTTDASLTNHRLVLSK